MEHCASILDTHVVASTEDLAVGSDETGANGDAAFCCAGAGFFERGKEAGVLCRHFQRVCYLRERSGARETLGDEEILKLSRGKKAGIRLNDMIDIVFSCHNKLESAGEAWLKTWRPRGKDYVAALNLLRSCNIFQKLHPQGPQISDADSLSRTSLVLHRVRRR